MITVENIYFIKVGSSDKKKMFNQIKILLLTKILLHPFDDACFYHCTPPCQLICTTFQLKIFKKS